MKAKVLYCDRFCAACCVCSVGSLVPVGPGAVVPVSAAVVANGVDIPNAVSCRHKHATPSTYCE